MIDVVLGIILAALVARGWMRGLVREAIGLAVVLGGAFLAFRFSRPAGSLVAGIAGTSPEVSRLAGGVLVFLLVSGGAAVVSFVLHRGIRALPGLSTANRLGGAAFAALWSITLATLVASLLAVVPVPDAVASQLEESSVAGALTDPEGMPQAAIGAVAGDRVMRSVLRLEELVGKPRIVGGGAAPVQLPPADASSLETDAGHARELYDRLNQLRVAAGVAPVAWSDSLAAVAAAHATDMYTSGVFGAESDDTGLAARLEAAAIPVVVAGEAMALAATPEGAHQAIADGGQRAVVTDPRMRRCGIAVIDGPLGLMVVQVLAG